MTTGPYGESTAASDPYGYQPGNAGDPSQGYPAQIYPTQAYPAQTYPPQAYPAQTYPPQAYPAQTYPPQAYPPQPYPPAAYPAPGYGVPAVAYGAYRQPRNGLGTAALVLGIIGVVFCWIPFTGWILNILAITFGAIGHKRAVSREATNKSSAVAGLVLGVIGLGVWVAIIIVFMTAASSVGMLL